MTIGNWTRVTTFGLLALPCVGLGLLGGCDKKEGTDGAATAGADGGSETGDDEAESASGADASGGGQDGGADDGADADADGGGADDGAGDSGGADDGGFITPPDGGIEGQCDPAAQDCPEGQKCSSYVATPGQMTVDSTHCVDIMGDVQWGEACERIDGNDDCAAGLFCMTEVSGSTGTGLCLEYCEVNSPCEFGGTCFAFNDGALPLCEVECDPLAPACPGGQGCYSAFDSFVCAQPGFPAGAGGDGDPCATIQGCQPGLVCKGGTAGCNEESGCCTPICDLSEGTGQCTDASESCVPALDSPGPGQEDVGFCAIPE